MEVIELFNRYPYTNFHELNLDYFIQHFKEIFTEWEQLYNDLTSWKTDTTEELTQWRAGVEEDLDEREAALRAELEIWKQETADDISGWETATQNALDAWKTAATAQFEAIRAQAAASAEAAAASQTAAGSAAAAALLSATEAEEAAASIQTSAAQIQQNANDIDDLQANFVQIPAYTAIPKTSPLLTLSQTHGYLTPTNGIIHENAGYDIYTIDIAEETPLYIAQFTSDNRVLGIIVYNQHINTFPVNNTEAGPVYVAGYRSTEGNLPTEQTPITVNAGEMIAVFIQQRNTSGTIVYDNDFVLYIGEYQTYLANSVFLNTFQIEQAKNRTPYIVYETPESDIGSTAREELAIYIPATVGYIKYALVRREYNNKNYNTWQIYKAYACDDNRNIVYSITNAGEWEMAIRIQGAPDFMGGFAHGNEIVNAIAVFIDGKFISDISTISGEEFSEVRIVMTSSLYNPNDGATLETIGQFTPVAEHGREYVFSESGLKLYQDVILDTALTLIGSYMTMFPIIRGNDTVTPTQITDHYYANNNNIIYDVSVGASGSLGYGWKENVTKASIYGATSGVFASVEMLDQPDINNAGARLFQVEDTVNKYNKLYWSICGVGNIPYNAAFGERFGTITDYKIDVAF